MLKGADLSITLCIMIAMLYTSPFSEPLRRGFGIRKCSGATNNNSVREKHSHDKKTFYA